MQNWKKIGKTISTQQCCLWLKILSTLDIRDKCRETESQESKPKIMPFHGVQHQASHLKILLLHNHVSLKYCFIHRVIIQERVVTRSHDVHFPAKKCHPSNSCRGVQRKLHNGWKLDSTGKHTLYQHKCRDG